MNGGVTIREMESVARSLDGDIGLSNELGNVIDITDSSDALGLNMLMNQAKVNVTQNQGGSSGTTISIAPPAPSSNFGGIEITPLEPLEPMSFSMDTAPAPPIEITFAKEPAAPQSSGGGLFGNAQTATGPSIAFAPAVQQRDPEKEKKEKIEYLNKLQRLEQKGFPVSRRFTMDNSLEEVKGEYDRLVDARNLEGSLRFQRQALMGVVTGLEWMNNRFDPFDLNLEGWSESVHENVEDFDEIFEELYDKYKDRGKMPPEARLLFSLAGSGFMVHVSNTFMKQRMPSASDVLKNNPELARQFAAAAANQAGSGFGNFMGMAMGAAGGGPQPQMQMPAGPQGISPEATTGAFFGASQRPDFTAQASMPNAPQVVASVEPPRQTARREMKGPSGVDDILKTFEEVRRQEVMGGMDGGMAGATMFAPPSMNSMAIPPAMNQPAISAVMEMESLASGDIGSTTESTRTGGGRRRRKAAITGNTLAVNV
jgi:hypothetical protein